MSIADELGKLDELRKQGLLTDAEFAEQKARLLGSGKVSSDLGDTSDEVPPDNYLAYAILVTIFCCLPFGIVAIVKSSAVNAAIARGSMDEARIAAADTMSWIKYALIAGVVVIVAYAIYAFALANSFSGSVRGYGY